MATDTQIIANRRNAKKSKGPRTKSGKALSRINALKHGLTARKILVSGESPQELETLHAELQREHNPATATECELVEFIAAQLWRLRRGAAFEARLLNQDTPRRREILEFHTVYVEGGPDPDKPLDPAMTYHPGRRTTGPSEVICFDDQNRGSSQATEVPDLDHVDRHQTSLLNGLIKALHLLFVLQSRRTTTK